MKAVFALLVGLAWAQVGFAQCVISKSDGTAARGLSDPLFAALTEETDCPTDVFQLKKVLNHDGLTIKPSMVANRGHHNPAAGSFSFFEIASGFSKALNTEVKSGTFYFGHFTGLNEFGEVDLDQSPAPGKLLIELITWDEKARHYNFYELIGTATGGNWFFRGNSKDAFADNRMLHLQANPARPQFGNAMRCSGCHTSGGPIMKELEAPHNDWWTAKRELPFKPNKESANLAIYTAKLRDASEFAAAVKDGQKLLEDSEPFQAFKKTLSLQEQLRPLFCTTEINLVSSDSPLEDNVRALNVPSEYWVGAFFAKSQPNVLMAKASYLTATKPFGFKFPETNQTDADHAWLAPVKGHSDFLQIETLIARGTITDEFAADVLAVDFKNPLFSKARCELLRLVPKNQTADWMNTFETALASATNPGAATLHAHLKDQEKDMTSHLANAESYLAEVSRAVGEPQALIAQIRKLQTNREAVFANEISKNPKGQILEPGFRVIFPVPSP